MTERNVLRGMVVLGMFFWGVTLAHRGFDWAILILAAVLVAWSVFHLMMLDDEHRE